MNRQSIEERAKEMRRPKNIQALLQRVKQQQEQHQAVQKSYADILDTITQQQH